MRYGISRSLFLGVASVLLCVVGTGAGDANEPYHANINPANFQNPVENPYCPFRPGTTWKFVEKHGDEVQENTITVTHDTKLILGVKCTVVHDVVSEGGKVTEDTLDWMATDKDGNVWYFGEDTRELKGKELVKTNGSWEAGVDGGEAGILLPGVAKPGEPYRQEYGPGHAEDMGKIVEINQPVTVPAGEYKDCVKTEEWSLLEHGGHDFKWYAKGIGFCKEAAADGTIVELISITHE